MAEVNLSLINKLIDWFRGQIKLYYKYYAKPRTIHLAYDFPNIMFENNAICAFILNVILGKIHLVL